MATATAAWCASSDCPAPLTSEERRGALTAVIVAALPVFAVADTVDELDSALGETTDSPRRRAPDETPFGARAGEASIHA